MAQISKVQIHVSYWIRFRTIESDGTRAMQSLPAIRGFVIAYAAQILKHVRYMHLYYMQGTHLMYDI